jgi:hypothetical protein
VDSGQETDLTGTPTPLPTQFQSCEAVVCPNGVGEYYKRIINTQVHFYLNCNTNFFWTEDVVIKMNCSQNPEFEPKSCSNVCRYGGEVSNGNTVYQNIKTQAYFQSDQKTKLVDYLSRARYCGCAQPTPTRAPEVTNPFIQGKIFRYYNCINNHNTEAPWLVCWGGACGNKICLVEDTHLYCCGSRTQ